MTAKPNLAADLMTRLRKQATLTVDSSVDNLPVPFRRESQLLMLEAAAEIEQLSWMVTTEAKNSALREEESKENSKRRLRAAKRRALQAEAADTHPHKCVNIVCAWPSSPGRGMCLGHWIEYCDRWSLEVSDSDRALWSRIASKIGFHRLINAPGVEFTKADYDTV